MKQCGNITGRSKSSSKPTPRNLYPLRSLSKLNKKRKRTKNAKTIGPKRTGEGNLRTKKYTVKRKNRKATFSARRAARQARSVSTSSVESGSSCSTCKTSCRGLQRKKPDETSCASQSISGSFQDSIPASKDISPDASQLNPAFELWDLNIAQANHEPLQTEGFEAPGAPPVPTKPREKPHGHCPTSG
ncbi:hypothetical protein KC19_VG121700 [Ceratodon purpureus]|uniref:Uncharacterized protein n=1 Tax=Ceratodon purpureus TaxID=3225 RepID=A0A8T0HPI3_CERPU|nr:hypothetical protein KC19_VG121700 [Ceratodon purpureus]KAG0572746.1 hypothetical protein KC19_VG121700 [Ceratodon purpureus]